MLDQRKRKLEVLLDQTEKKRLRLVEFFFLYFIVHNCILLECNLCTNFALFTSLNIDVLHLIIMINLCFTFVGAILLIGDKIKVQDDI